jgi:hypothetical protein
MQIIIEVSKERMQEWRIRRHKNRTVQRKNGRKKIQEQKEEKNQRK